MFHELFYSVLNHGLRVAFAALPAMPLLGQKQLAPRIENIVLVHGAFADGSSWSKVIPLLRRWAITWLRCRTR